jgi:hypothetical protein
VIGVRSRALATATGTWPRNRKSAPSADFASGKEAVLKAAGISFQRARVLKGRITMQLTVSLRGVRAIALPIHSAEEIEKIEQRFAAFAAKVGMDADRFAREMVLAFDALGLDGNNRLMAECQLCGLVYFALNIEGSAGRPGLLKNYLAAHDFTVDLTCDHRHERITWHVDGFSERPN